MKINVADIASTIAELGIPFESQANYLVAAIARVLGYLLPIPAEAVTGHPSEYFNAHYPKLVADALNALNERMPVDYNQVLALTQKIWEVRYGLVHASRDMQAWVVIDSCISKADLGFDIDLRDPALQRLGSFIAQGVEQ